MSRINTDIQHLIALFYTAPDVLLDQRSSSKKPNPSIDVVLRRFTKEMQSGADQVLVSKKYPGEKLVAIQERESNLLLRLRSLKFSPPGGSPINVKDRVNYLHSFDGDASLLVSGGAVSNTVPVEKIEMHWTGFDLQDWRRIFKNQKDSPFRDVKFVLALLRAALKALYPLHGSGWLHCDGKLDNWCLKWVEGSLSAAGEPLAGKLNPDNLRLIDMGLTLEEAARRDNSILKGLALPADSGLRHIELIGHAHEAAKNGDFEPLKRLDWRCDLMALGEMFDSLHRWVAIDTDELNKGLSNILLNLKDPNQSQGATPPMPHLDLINEINELLADGGTDKTWPFCIDGAVMPGAVALPPTVYSSVHDDFGTGQNKIADDKPIATADPTPVPLGLLVRYEQWLTKSGTSVPAVGAGLLIAAAAVYWYFSANVTPRPMAGATPNTAVVQAKNTANNGEELMAKLYANAQTAEAAQPGNARVLQMQATSRRPYNMGEKIEFKVTTPAEGYLTILLLDQGNKWPQLQPILTNIDLKNELAKRPGQPLTMPNPFIPLVAKPPAGTTHAIAVVTPFEFGWAARIDADKFDLSALQNAVASAIVTIEIRP